MIECDLSIYFEDKFIFSLGTGMETICRFAKLADGGIPGANEVIKSFGCNRDVC